MTMSLQSTPVCLSRLSFLCMVALVLGGCANTTRVAAPEADPWPVSFKESGPWLQADVGTQAANVPDQWWQLFNDPVLNELQDRLVVGNQNLRAVVAQVAHARATLGSREAARLPTFGLNASATRADSLNSDSTAGQPPRNTVSLSGSASWEIDLWGRLSHGVDSAQASYQASLQDLAAARLSAQSTLAQTYFALRTAEAQQALIERSIAVYQRSLELTQARQQSGVAPLTDVLQAQTQLRTAQAQGIEAGAQRAQLEHAIAVLLGQAPSALSLASTASLPHTPDVPALLPSTLLERRPDINASAQRVRAAYAQIGVARSAYFPSITLGATGGYRHSALEGLLSAPHRFWSLGPALALAIFDGGARQAATEQARANADQATASYRQTVLIALQEVEDNLVLTARLGQEAGLQREALGFAQRNLEITQDQYRVGTVSYLNVVTAQSTALLSERTLLDVRARQLTAASHLLRNIAGRWDPVQDGERLASTASR